ncbi:nuclear transport factor 2 family protein [Arthrobacter sp. ISL-69]|uniref:nuclear transport factor 2 family protein n=1 Tax=Arthrobacter sp. ISL-69 TaxID=2819113 RepID=UPI001BE5FE79|nr:nuclear transport factor 2 family protein [Arthrobacter sp. ISL-69]MBT2536757.1 nuclear transport factor 2 family protein [Arthrobacter sp. ISL-69]
MPDSSVEGIARSYIQAVGSHNMEALENLLGEDLLATFAGTTLDKAGWTTAIKRLLPALVRNEIREVFTAQDRACVVYDFITDTAAGAVRCIELLTVNADKISEIELVLDRAAFAPVNAALKARVPPAQ